MIVSNLATTVLTDVVIYMPSSYFDALTSSLFDYFVFWLMSQTPILHPKITNLILKHKYLQ